MLRFGKGPASAGPKTPGRLNTRAAGRARKASLRGELIIRYPTARLKSCPSHTSACGFKHPASSSRLGDATSGPKAWLTGSEQFERWHAFPFCGPRARKRMRGDPKYGRKKRGSMDKLNRFSL